jgi:hypothetical protein
MADEKTAVVFTAYEYRGFKVSFTIRGDSISECLDSMEGQIDSLLKVGNKPWLDRFNVAEGEVEREAKPAPPKDEVMGDFLGLLKFPPKASDLKSGQTYELTVNKYELKDGELRFYGEGEYPAHTHKLNEYGVKVMADLFGATWDKHFKGEGDIPKGDLIIKIEGSKKLTKHGNPYKNLIGQRRPE